MARAAFNLSIRISSIECHKEADGAGDAEPYLWPVFFKIDGDTYAVDAVGLIGFPTIESTNGKHGNLGNTDVGEGDRVSVPPALGAATMLLKPIPVNDPSVRVLLGDDLPGIAGVVVVLMEEDGWPNDLAIAGYEALVDGIRLGLTKAMASFQHDSSPPSDDEIDARIAQVETLAAKMVRGAILNAMSGGQIAGFGTIRNNDDQIGTANWWVTQDDFALSNTKAFHRRWDDAESKGNGDWSVKVTFTNLDAPPPPVDLNQCAKIAEEIEVLQEDLQDDVDFQEARRIRRKIAELRNASSQLGCPQD